MRGRWIVAGALTALVVGLAPAAEAADYPTGWVCRDLTTGPSAGQSSCTITYPRLKSTRNEMKPQYAAAAAMNKAIVQATAAGLDLASTPEFGCRHITKDRWRCQGFARVAPPA